MKRADLVLPVRERLRRLLPPLAAHEVPSVINRPFGSAVEFSWAVPGNQ